ncbi:MAG: GGDEF domain-containing protein [Granulosicoccus sp.]|nr:GGDEF domain-containing protein [Granulosicoccus sp.]
MFNSPCISGIALPIPILSFGNFGKMMNPTIKPPSSHPNNPGSRYTALYLATLLGILCLLALWPNLRTNQNVSWFGQLDNAQSVALFFAITTVALLAVIMLVLQSKLQALETARGIDNHAALHDELTGAANRRQFEIRLQELLLDQEPSHTLLMIDLDRFKPINDIYGHAAGDAVLKEITTGIKSLVQHKDLIARLGGDEFAMLLPDTSKASADKIALEIQHYINRFRLTWQDSPLSVGASMGLVNLDQPGLTPAALLAASDEALYAAKKAGRGAIFATDVGLNVEQPRQFRRVNKETSETKNSADSHIPVNGGTQQLQARLMVNATPATDNERRRKNGARRRYEKQHWISVEPSTIGDKNAPGMMMRELISDASAQDDGGADFARWVMGMAIDAATRSNQLVLGRTEFMLHLPARAFVVVPGLALELIRCNALSHLPMRHITVVLHEIDTVYDSPALKDTAQNFHAHEIRLGYEIRADDLDVLAPLRCIQFEEIYLGQEVVKKLRPESSNNPTLDALLAIAENSKVSLASTNVTTNEEANLLIQKGIKRISGSATNALLPLHEVLSNLDQRDDKRPIIKSIG